MPSEYYGNPHEGSFPLPYPQPVSSPTLAKKKWWQRWGCWLAIILVVCLVGCGSLAVGVYFFFQFLWHSPAADVTNRYYTAIEHQDYATAYSFLDAPKITLNGQQLTQNAYTQAASSLDEQRGKVVSYSLPSISIESEGGVGSAQITVNVTRSKGNPYEVHLQLQQEYSGWKIVSIDDI